MKRSVFITGAAGFVGAYFARHALDSGLDVHVFLRKSSNTWRIKDILGRCTVHNGDLTNLDDIDASMKDARPDAAFHFGTYGANQRVQKDTDLIFNTNVVGAWNIAQAAKKNRLECLINIGSSSEYGPKKKPMVETDNPEPDNVYGSTKAASTMMLSSFAKANGLPYATLRLFSVYGPYEDKERLMPTIILACLNGYDPRLANKDSVRDFIYAGDVAEACMRSMEAVLEKRISPGEIINIGSGKEYKVSEVVDIIGDISGRKINPRWGSVASSQPNEPLSWVADISKAERLIGWKSRYGLREGLKMTFEWFENHKSLYPDGSEPGR